MDSSIWQNSAKHAVAKTLSWKILRNRRIPKSIDKKEQQLRDDLRRCTRLYGFTRYLNRSVPSWLAPAHRLGRVVQWSGVPCVSCVTKSARPRDFLNPLLYTLKTTSLMKWRIVRTLDDWTNEGESDWKERRVSQELVWFDIISQWWIKKHNFYKFWGIFACRHVALLKQNKRKTPVDKPRTTRQGVSSKWITQSSNGSQLLFCFPYFLDLRKGWVSFSRVQFHQLAVPVLGEAHAFVQARASKTNVQLKSPRGWGSVLVFDDTTQCSITSDTGIRTFLHRKAQFWCFQHESASLYMAHTSSPCLTQNWQDKVLAFPPDTEQ